MDLNELATAPPTVDQQLEGPFILQVVSISKKNMEPTTTTAATITSGNLTVIFTDGRNQYTAAETFGKVERLK